MAILTTLNYAIQNRVFAQNSWIIFNYFVNYFLLQYLNFEQVNFKFVLAH